MMMFPDFNDPAYSEQGHCTDFPEYGKQCDLIEPWGGYRRGAIVAQTPKGFVVQLSSGAEIDVHPDEIEIDYRPLIIGSVFTVSKCGGCTNDLL